MGLISMPNSCGEFADDDETVEPKDEINSDWSLYEGAILRTGKRYVDYIRNGNPLDLCGSSRVPIPLFAGQKFRDATTYGLNLEFGGKITFSIKFGGFVFRERDLRYETL